MARLVAAVLCLACVAASEDSLFGHDTEALLQSKRATRSHVSVEVWNRMMDNIMNQVGDKSYSEVTPEVKAGIEKMIGLIDGIEQYLRNAFSARQDEITGFEKKLIDMDAQCGTEKYTADGYGESLQKCYKGSHAERTRLENCYEEKGRSWQATDDACRGSNTNRHYSWEVPYDSLDWQHCDVSEWSDCDYIGCADYSKIKTFVKELGPKIDAAYNDYLSDTDRCAQMKYSYENQESNCKKMRETWKGWGKECKTDYDSARLSICTFGGFMQGKCIEIVHFNQTRIKLWDPADERAGEEWGAVSMIRCMLENYIEGGTFSADMKETCAYKVDMKGIKGVHYGNKAPDYPCVEIPYKFVKELSDEAAADASVAHLLVAQTLTNALANGDATPFGEVFSFCGEHENDHKCPYAVPYDGEKCEHEYLECKYENKACCPYQAREPTVIAVCNDGYWEVTRIDLNCDDYDCDEPPVEPTPPPTYLPPTDYPTPPPYTYPPTPAPTEPYTTAPPTPAPTTTTTTEPYEPTPAPTYTKTTTYKPTQL